MVACGCEHEKEHDHSNHSLDDSDSAALTLDR